MSSCPGSTFLEKDGTFTNAERRINRVRKVMSPKNGYADWEVTQKLARPWGRTGTTPIRLKSWMKSPPRRRASRV
jgi:predicted molibdopterin-dependent oxidoreductase YjgC